MTNAILSEWVSLRVPRLSTPQNEEMACFLARPGAAMSGSSWPSVIVLMEIFGVNAHIRSVTERIAAEGYVALAINYYHRSTPNLELGYTEADVAEGRQHKDLTTRKGLMADVAAALDYLKSRPDVQPNNKFGTIGYCFGGHVAYLAAATFPEIAATASFYGGGVATMCPGENYATVELSPDIKGEMLCLFGADDPLIPAEAVKAVEDALSAAGVNHEVITYPGVDHGFFCDARGSYDENAAADAWEKVKNLFNKQLKQG